ncbi:DUF1232 domain-containing protein [Spirulina subsalsa FACHB-351]|uniref:DUF1232 domain-containing protein n=1 Tax=Spirulina subsalsa FACHB-351 TaxID=234711 RepID=A0ABT3L1G9_9CYAN|nr:DUF1232 domain-containing protein [Spirulina subsalsa]MCW6035326.1 DUF1232 domain-containing protein [Spirulina subsalsa FACHB-351]
MKKLVESFYVWYRKTLRNTKYRWFLIGGTLLYLISPIDISPDFIPIIGWIDDGIIATVLVTELTQLVLENRKRRKEGNMTQEEGGVKAESEVVVDVVAEPSTSAKV